MVRFLHEQAETEKTSVGGKPVVDVWVTLIPPSETLPVPPPLPSALPAPPSPNGSNASSRSTLPNDVSGNGERGGLASLSPPDCAKCPASHPHEYGHGFCCTKPSLDGEHCPALGGDCCLSPLPPPYGCESVARCGNNPTNKPACGPPPPSPKVRGPTHCLLTATCECVCVNTALFFARLFL
jgi:hypothetical protein